MEDTIHQAAATDEITLWSQAIYAQLTKALESCKRQQETVQTIISIELMKQSAQTESRC